MRRVEVFESLGGSFIGPHGCHSNVEYMIWCRRMWNKFALEKGIDISGLLSDETQSEFDLWLTKIQKRAESGAES